mgnify:CR=1 FL=1
MKNLFVAFAVVALTSTGYTQKSEDFIPRDAVTVFSLNNISLLKKIPLDKLVQYEFMNEVHQELFDGSTSGKTLKDSGIDFDQKLNIYYGLGNRYEVAGFTFGVDNLQALFTVFDDFTEEESPIEGVRFFSSYFNHILIKGNVGVLIRVDPVRKFVRQQADSVWKAQGRGSKYEYLDYEEATEDVILEETYEDDEEEDIYDVEDEVEIIEEGEEELVETVPLKNYNEIRDSISTSLKAQFLTDIAIDLFISSKNLKKSDRKLAELMTKEVEGVFYLDNERNLNKSANFYYLQHLFPGLLSNVSDLYQGNKILGEIRLSNDALTASVRAEYGPVLGDIYQTLNTSKFDKKVTNYIHKNNSAFFTYNINLREAYDQAFEVLMPMLREEKDPRVSGAILSFDLLNEFINKDALFDTYKGSMFGSFNGIKTVNVTKINYSYDEDFNYTEQEVKSEEKMPVFTIGFSTERHDIPEKVLTYTAKMTSECVKTGEVWRINNAIFNSIPLYIINKNGLFIMTNDEDLALYNSDGYDKQNKLSKDQIKMAKSSGFMYANIDWSRTITELPLEIFSSKQADIIQAMGGKTGNLTLTTSKTTSKETNYELKYAFNTAYTDPGEHVLDLVNSLFLLTK